MNKVIDIINHAGSEYGWCGDGDAILILARGVPLARVKGKSIAAYAAGLGVEVGYGAMPPALVLERLAAAAGDE